MRRAPRNAAASAGPSPHKVADIRDRQDEHERDLHLRRLRDGDRRQRTRRAATIAPAQEAFATAPRPAWAQEHGA